jgi:alcohol dehydrogenase (cytochrome c)
MAALLLGAAVLVAAVPSLSWRASLIVKHVRGDVSDLGSFELLAMLRPGSGYYLEPLLESGNPYGVIRNPYPAAEHTDAGERIYREQCSNCHGGEGTGGAVGPALATLQRKHGSSDWALFRTITRGIEGSSMLAQNLAPKQAWQVVSYLRSIEPGSEQPAEDFAGIAVTSVAFENILAGRSRAADWLTYSGDYDGKRFSELVEINSGNVADLKLLWMYQTDAADDYLETSPIVVDGKMFVTVSPGTVYALDASDGEVLWRFERPLPARLSLCCGTVNRGVAVLGTTIFWATVDAHLTAIDAATGRLLWETEVGDHATGYSITSAPLVVDNLVLIGVSGGEYGIRGYLDAYDAVSGERVWRFYTIPGPGEPGNETWSGDSWQRGGAGAWLTGSYDAASNTIFWGTGNPGPLYFGDDRLGDNLYANSVVALDADTGALKWHFQFTPHDLHDWAANQIPVLVDAQWQGQPRSMLLTANRNGFFYVLDRNTGQFLLAREFVKQNWAGGIDENGRPQLNPDAIPTPQGTLTWPSPHGGTNWQSPAYSPVTELFYVAALDGARVVYKQADTPEYTPGEPYFGSMHQLMAGDHKLTASLKAIDPQSGKIVWQYDNPPRRAVWRTGGVLATAGNIVFAGDFQSLYALDAETGDELWRINVGGYINAAPVTYQVDGRQQITVAAGRTIMTFGVSPARPSRDSQPEEIEP